MSTYVSTDVSPRTSSPFALQPAKRVVKRKTRITIYLDDEVLHEFRTLAEQCGKGYQTLINAALRTGLAPAQQEDSVANPLETRGQ